MGFDESRMCSGSMQPGTPIEDLSYSRFQQAMRWAKCSICQRTLSVVSSSHMQDLRVVRHYPDPRVVGQT